MSAATGWIPARARPWAGVAATCVVAVVVVAAIGWALWPSPPSAAVLNTGTNRHLVTVVVDEPRRGSSTVEVRVADRTGTPARDARVRIDAVMLLMGHATPTLTAARVAPGYFRAPGLDLMATGPWELTVTVEPRVGAPDTVTVPLDVGG